MAKPKDGDTYVRSLKAPVAAIAGELREMVRKTAPDLEEKIRYSFPHYDLDGTVVYIMAASEHVDLVFYDGVDLKDPKTLLVGRGKRLRHVKIRTPGDVRNPALKALVKEAVKVRTQAAK